VWGAGAPRGARVEGPRGRPREEGWEPRAGEAEAEVGRVAEAAEVREADRGGGPRLSFTRCWMDRGRGAGAGAGEAAAGAVRV
jgi:hypothetical protein